MAFKIKKPTTFHRNFKSQVKLSVITLQWESTNVIWGFGDKHITFLIVN